MKRPRTILAVDDDFAMLLAIKHRLEHAGYQVETASCGAEAINIVRDKHIDVISLDVGLPGDMSGLDIASHLHGDPHTAEIPIIFITGYADESFKQRCRAVGARYFLSKPYDPDLLIQVLRSIFGEDALSEAQRISSAKRRQPV